MSTDTTATPGVDTPVALLLCREEGLARLLEIELSALGLRTHRVDALPGIMPDTPDRTAPRLLVIDGDDLTPADSRASGELGACPRLIFTRTPAAHAPIDEDKGMLLRRPFALTELEAAVRRLTAMPSPTRVSVPAVPVSAMPSASLMRTPSVAASSSETVGSDGVPSDIVADMADGIPLGYLTIGSRRIALTPTEQAMLSCLYAHRGETVSRATLAALAGGGGNSVDVYICHLRTKIEKPLGRRLIVTVRGEGYRID